MANIKISELNPLLTVEDADVLPIVDNAVTKKVTAAILRSYTQGNSVLLTGAQTVAGIKTFTSQLASSVATGTAPFSVASTTKVTNLNADLLDGLSSADFQATLSGTGIVKSTAGTISYLTDNSANWNTAFNDKINSAAVTGSGTNTLTLTQQDAGTITATWVNGTLIREIRNNTGATLTKGTIVYISGATGNKPTVTKAIATGDTSSAQTFGFVQESIANNANGYVVVVGDLTGVDTSAFAEGAQLYLSATTAGTFTDVKQYAPNHLVYVGIVTRAHPTLGQIEVNIQNGYELDELHNVAAQSPSNGDILQYVTSTGLWTKVGGTTSAISEGSNLYFTNARSRSAISLTTSGTSGAATYNSTTGVLNVPNYADGGITSLNGLTALTQTFAVGTSGTDFGISSATSTHTFNLPTASATNRGALSSADWTIFNNKQNALTNPITGTGTTNYLPKFTGASALGNSLVFDNGTNVGIGTITSDAKLEIAGLSGKIFKVGTLTNDGGWNHAFGVENGNGLFISKINAANNTAANKVASISRSDTEGGRLFLYDLLGNVTVSFKGNGASYFNSGNVLIGTTTSSSYKLDVNGTARVSGALTANNGIFNGVSSTNLKVQNGANANTLFLIQSFGTEALGENASILFKSAANSTDTTYAKGLISFVNNGTGYGRGSLIFATNNSADSANVTASDVRLTIAANGAATFSSSVTASSLIKSGGTSSQYLMADGSTSTLTNPITGSGTTNYLPKFTGASALGNSSIFDDGNIGIGTITPSQKLEVSGGSIIASGFGNRAVGTGKALELGMDGSYGIIQAIDRTGLVNIPIYMSGSATYIMNGNVGIGTTSPATLFHASKTYSAPTGGIDSNIQILASNTSGASGLGMLASNSSVSFLHFGDTDSANIGQIAYTHANDNMLFVANGAERMRITSAGNVLIGTTTDGGSKLKVVGLPTSSAGLSAGDIWNDGGTLKIV